MEVLYLLAAGLSYAAFEWCLRRDLLLLVILSAIGAALFTTLALQCLLDTKPFGTP